MSEMETNANQKVSCVVNYAYDASESDELTVRPGDILWDVDRLPGGWWRGELRGRRGMFPDNFVSVLTEPGITKPGGAGVQGRCRAVFSYQPANPDELPLCVGDVLEVLGEVEEGWWQGRRQGRVGVFPSNFVVMLDPPQPAPPFEPAPALPPKPDVASTPAPNVQRRAGMPRRLRVMRDKKRKLRKLWQRTRCPSVKHDLNQISEQLSEEVQAWRETWDDLVDEAVVKEQCRVLFPYTAVNEDELTLAEGDIVNIVSKDAPDRGWWRGELQGRVGLFPDNFVQLLPTVAAEVEEKKPERPPSKTTAIYPVLNKYSEKTASVKELTTSKISMHKENILSKETSTQSTVTHTNKSESEKLIHNETVIDGTIDGQVKKPPVPLKKSPTPTSGVGGLFSGLKSKMLSSSDKEKEKDKSLSNALPNSGSSSSGEWDRIDGGGASKPAANATAAANSNNAANSTNTFDHIERNTILSDPRAGRVKAPRRRPPSQALRDDTPQQIGLSNGHEVPTEKPPAPADKPPLSLAEEIKPRTREWEKHRAPWMEELKLNQAKKTSFIDVGKSRSVSASSDAGVASKAGGGSTDRILDCGLEDERKRSTHSMEMSKSTSSISNRISVLESFDETKVRHSLDSNAKKEVSPATRDPETLPAKAPVLTSPTAAGRTLVSMLEEIKKPPAPSPPLASVRTNTEIITDKSPNSRIEKSVTTSEKQSENSRNSGGVFEKSTLERMEKVEDKTEKSQDKSASNTLERRLHGGLVKEKSDGNDMLIAQLNNRILNLEKLLEVQNTMFKTAIEELTLKLKLESDKRQALQAEVEKLAHCITQV